MGSGRLKKTFNSIQDKLPIDWKKQIISEYSEGASDVEIKAMFVVWLDSLSNDLWDRWLLEEPIFSETIKKGRQLSAGWWQRSGRKNLTTKDFSYTGWYMNMKNRFGWADKTEQNINQKTKVEVELTDEELKKEIKRFNDFTK